MSSPEYLSWVRVVGLSQTLTDDDIAAHFQTARCGSGLVKKLVYLGPHRTAAMIGIEGIDSSGRCTRDKQLKFFKLATVGVTIFGLCRSIS